MLDVQNLSVAFDGREVLTGIDLTVAEGEIVALIGHNGAGKTTLLRTVMGLLAHSSGRVTAMGSPVRLGSAVAVARSGLAFVPQRRNVFRDPHRGRKSRPGTGRSRHQCGALAGLSMSYFPFLPTGRVALPASCPAGSSKCWPLRSHCCAAQSLSCWTNLRQDYRPC